MAAASAILFAKLMSRINTASQIESLLKAQANINSIIDIDFKKDVQKVLHIFYRINQKKFTHSHISNLIVEGSYNDGQEKAQDFLENNQKNHPSERLNRKLVYAKRYHPDSEIVGAWALLNNASEEEAIGEIEGEVKDIQRSLIESYCEQKVKVKK
jgi:hypothetical protein